MTTGDTNSPMATGADTEGMLLIHRVIRRELSLAPASLRDYGSGPADQPSQVAANGISETKSLLSPRL